MKQFINETSTLISFQLKMNDISELGGTYNYMTLKRRSFDNNRIHKQTLMSNK